MIELKTYKLKEEFFKELNISASQWKCKKEELLSWLENFYDYSIVEGCPILITIKEVYGDYKPLPRKKYETNKEQKLADYEEFTKSKLTHEYQPNSKSRVARQAIAEFGYEKYNHFSEKNVARCYITPAFNKYAESDNHRMWVWYSTYLPINDTILTDWHNILKRYKQDEKSIFQVYTDYCQDEVGIEAIQEKKNGYLLAMQEFKEKYGDFPVNVAKWRLKDPQLN